MIKPSSSAINKVQQEQSSHDDNSKPDLDLSASHCYDASITYKITSIIDVCKAVSGNKQAGDEDKSGG